MSNLHKPKKGEYWTIEFGLKNKTKHIVLVLEDKELQFPNWRVHDFKCRFDDMKEVLIAGECFIEKWD